MTERRDGAVRDGTRQRGARRSARPEADPDRPPVCDVVILGGGPAGAAAAITSARLGLSTIVIRPRRNPAAAPADTVPPGFPEALERLGVRTAGLCRQGRVIAPCSQTIIGLHIDRAAVERALVRTAIRAGVTLLRDVAEAPIIETGRIVGVRLAGAGPLRSKVLIDATGSAGWLRRELALRRVALSDPMTAARGQIRGLLPTLGRDGMAFTPHPRGWTYLVAHDGLVSWTALCADGGRPERPRALAMLPDSLAARHWSVGWQLIRPLAGPGWLIAGEAAGRVDPAAGSGLSDALAGGARAAHTAALCIGDPGQATALQAAYDDWYSDLVTDRAAELRRRYEMHGIRLDRHQMRCDAA